MPCQASLNEAGGPQLSVVNTVNHLHLSNYKLLLLSAVSRDVPLPTHRRMHAENPESPGQVEAVAGTALVVGNHGAAPSRFFRSMDAFQDLGDPGQELLSVLVPMHLASGGRL